MGLVTGFFDYVVGRLRDITPIDILDIAIVSIIFYYLFKFIRDRRAGKLAIGILFIVVVLLFSDLFNMHALNFLLGNVVQVGIIGLLIVFQSELRFLLEKVGGNSFLSNINRRTENRAAADVFKCVDAVTQACEFFSGEMVGALIVFENTTKLGDIIKTGTVIDAEPTDYLLKNIFFNKAPMHDGALVIRSCRLYSAGCFLPLSNDQGINRDLGTRHRAALGMSENSDALVVVVSEETGNISVAREGVLTRGYTPEKLRRTLIDFLIGETDKKNKMLGKKDKTDTERNAERTASK